MKSHHDDDVAWYNDNGDNIADQTRPVAPKAPNELGLYDMSGNVDEMCQGWYGEYSNEAQTNPTGPEWGVNEYKVIRGGGWYHPATVCRVSCRGAEYKYGGIRYIGLRLAL